MWNIFFRCHRCFMAPTEAECKSFLFFKAKVGKVVKAESGYGSYSVYMACICSGHVTVDNVSLKVYSRSPLFGYTVCAG